jgi:hypothetical protein
MGKMVITATTLSLCVLGAGAYYLADAAEYERMPSVTAPPPVDYHFEDMGLPSEAIAVYEYYGSADESQRPDFDVTIDGQILFVDE